MMPLSFIVVCEAAADFRTATALAERLICEQSDDWVVDYLTSCPLWHGLDRARPYLLWTEIAKLAEKARIKAHGHFDGEPGKYDAQNTRRALLLFKKWGLEGRPIDGVLLIRDDDGEGRRVWLEKGRNSVHEFHDRVAIGLARFERECWVLAGYDPVDSVEESRLAEIRAELGFDPREKSHQLTAKRDRNTRSAKYILDILTQGDFVRESMCWTQTSLDILRQRGRENGLANFLKDIESRLVPLFAGRGPS